MKIRSIVPLTLAVLALVLGASAASADEPATEQAAATTEEPAAAPAEVEEAGQPAAEAASEAAPALTAGAPPWQAQGCDQGCTCIGDLGAFCAPSCMTCNVNRTACTYACASHGGVQNFSCGAGGISCLCVDGANDNCPCS